MIDDYEGHDIGRNIHPYALDDCLKESPEELSVDAFMSWDQYFRYMVGHDVWLDEFACSGHTRYLIKEGLLDAWHYEPTNRIVVTGITEKGRKVLDHYKMLREL